MKNQNTFISICIPAYERTDYLYRLLKSIEIQTFKNYEVIISDDSITDNNKFLIEKFEMLNIKYIKNITPLGSPKNWNNAISFAQYDWIKVMHDDDFFCTPKSLEIFSNAIINYPNKAFIFSSHYSLKESSKLKKLVEINFLEKYFLHKSRFILFYKNLIGHPSCVIYKKDCDIEFDNKFKWVVDIEFYFRYLNKHNSTYFIRTPLITLSDNESQITKQVFRNFEIEIRENHMLLEKIGKSSIKNIILFDYFWRLYRNLGVRNQSEIENLNVTFNISLKKMLAFQLNFPLSLLRIGPISKIIMLICYFYILTDKNDV